MTRRIAWVGSCAVLLVWGLTPNQQAQALECTGVSVVVEPRAVSGASPVTGCAAAPGSGIEALRQAGFAVSLGTGSYSGGFICAINGAPVTGCADVDQDTYWSYWYRLAGTTSWVYSQTGAAGRRPQVGDAEAWVWQAGGEVEPPTPLAITPRPTVDPLPPRAVTESTRPPTAPAAQAPDPSASSASPGGTRPIESRPDPEPTATAQPTQTGPPPTATTPASTPTAGSRATRAAAPPAQTPPAAAAAATSSGGWPPWSGVLGAALALLLGADIVRRLRAAR